MAKKPKFPVMLAQKFNVKRIDNWPVAVEPKLDGIRILVVLKIIDDEFEVGSYTRAGNLITSLEAIEDAVADTYAETGWTHDIVLDGEVFCGSFAETTSAVRKTKQQATNAVLTIFDMIPVSEWEEGSSLDFQGRREQLYEFFRAKHSDTKNIALSRAVLADSVDEIEARYKECRQLGHEGAMVKQLRGEKSHWVPKRSWAWMKMKEESTADCKIVGAEVGEGKFSHTLGNLLVKHGEQIVGVGTGLSDGERQKLWKMHLDGKLEGLTAEIAYQEVTPDGSLRFPVYKHLRLDK